ncbi:hypothetical protein GOBAR_DD25936 [Gossypium barbadense]|nr:hypothetical protein GOBAR_DD25936 [Gossypium barbadense]
MKLKEIQYRLPKKAHRPSATSEDKLACPPSTRTGRAITKASKASTSSHHKGFDRNGHQSHKRTAIKETMERYIARNTPGGPSRASLTKETSLPATNPKQRTLNEPPKSDTHINSRDLEHTIHREATRV